MTTPWLTDAMVRALLANRKTQKLRQAKVEALEEGPELRIPLVEL